MGFFWCSWLIVGSIWCINNILAYSVQRLDESKTQPLNLEIDFYSNFATQKFLDQKPESSDVFQSRDVDPSQPVGSDSSKKRMYLLFLHNNDNYTGVNDTTPLDSWSVVWYVASFGGLIVFFLIVSCSEWCCRRAIRNNQNSTRTGVNPSTPTVPDTPPPSYDHFAPPSYESICLGRSGKGAEKSEYDIYVVPVHTLGTLVESRHEDAPPSYVSASGRDFVPAVRLDNHVS